MTEGVTESACPSCRMLDIGNGRYCIRCGAILKPVYCSHCGTMNPDDLAQCMECGTAIPRLTDVQWSQIVTVAEPAMTDEKLDNGSANTEVTQLAGQSSKKMPLSSRIRAKLIRRKSND
jgi:ribosomal protein S26